MTGQMGLVFPTPGASTDVWGVTLDTMLTLVEQHDHTSGKGSLIRSGSIGINADVSWASYAITAAKAIAFTEVASTAVVGYSDALFVNSADHNLYFRNNGGTNVQLTAGSTLNVSIVGGIGGDYASVAALFSYDDATRRYLAQQEGSPRPWAGFATADIDLYQKAASITNKVTLKSPSALAASYALTFPAALPGSQLLTQIDATGNVIASNTLPVNTNLTMSGTGHVLRGARTIPVQINRFTSLNISGGGASSASLGAAGASNPASATNAFLLPLSTADFRLMTITGANVWASVAGGNVTFTLMYTTSGGNLFSTGGTVATSSVTPQYTAVALTGFPFNCSVFTGGETFYLQVACAAGVTTCNILSVDFITTVPT